MFEHFLGKQVKCPYIDGKQYRIARGKLSEINKEFVKIEGKIGVIIINKSSIQRMSLLK